MGRYLGITVKRLALCQCLDGHVKEPYEMSMALGARPSVKLLLQSAYTSMCCHIYNWNIVAVLFHFLKHIQTLPRIAMVVYYAFTPWFIVIGTSPILVVMEHCLMQTMTENREKYDKVCYLLCYVLFSSISKWVRCKLLVTHFLVFVVVFLG